MCDPFHLVNIFDEIDGQVDVFKELFLDTQSEHAPIKRIKIKSRPKSVYHTWDQTIDQNLRQLAKKGT